MKVIIAAALLFLSADLYSQGKPDHSLETEAGYGKGDYGKRTWKINLNDTFKSEDLKFSNYFEYEYFKNSGNAVLEDFSIFHEAVKLNLSDYLLGGTLSSEYDESEDFVPGLEYSAFFGKNFQLSGNSDFELLLVATNAVRYSKKYKRVPFICPLAAYTHKGSHYILRIGVPLLFMYFNGNFSAGFTGIPPVNSRCFVKYSFLPNLSLEGFAETKFNKIESKKFDDDDKLNLFSVSAGCKVNFYFTRYTGISLSGGYQFLGREWISDSWKGYKDRKNIDDSLFVKTAFSIIL